MGRTQNRIQFTPDVLSADIIGFSMYDKNRGEFYYESGAVMCNLLLADEINRTSSKTQSALLKVMDAGNLLSEIQPIITSETLLRIQKEVEDIFIHDVIYRCMGEAKLQKKNIY